MGKRKNNTCGIYRILNLKNLKGYIGYSEQIETRWDNHKTYLKNNKHSNDHLQKAWNIYGKESFLFERIELLPTGLTKKEYEAVETKWVLFYNTYKSEFGYNGCLPGAIPLKAEGENKTKEKIGALLHKIVSINIETKEVLEFDNAPKAALFYSFTLDRIHKCLKYWKDLSKYDANATRSHKGFIFVKLSLYDPLFNYVEFKKEKLKPAPKPQNKRNYKKNPEDIIPYEKRNILRQSIRLVDKNTGVEFIEHGILPTCKKYKFVMSKVHNCLQAPFKQRSHHGYWFEKIKNLEN